MQGECRSVLTRITTTQYDLFRAMDFIFLLQNTYKLIKNDLTTGANQGKSIFRDINEIPGFVNNRALSNVADRRV